MSTRSRLHPLSPVLRGLRFSVLIVAALSWQSFDSLGPRRWALAVAAIGVLVLIGSVISYVVTGYEVVSRELRIHEGVLFRRNRAIPVERLQSVELVQPLLARLAGLAELRFEVVGGARTEATLAFLRRDQAVALRARLLDLAAQARSGTLGTHTPAQPVTHPEHLLFRVRNRDLFFSQLLRPVWWLLPAGIAVPVVDAVVDGELGFVTVASTATAIIGAISAPVRVLLGDWSFTLATAADGLRVRRGLLETRATTVPAGRIQSVLVEWPRLWRGVGWVRASMHVAGVRGQEGEGPPRAGLLPVGRVEELESILAQAVPGVVLRDIAVHPAPSRARLFAPLGWRVLGYHVGPHVFASRSGLITRRLAIVPYARIQSVRVRQGPLQRRRRLASVFVDVAGGGPSALAAHIDIAVAQPLARELAERSRAARRAPA